MVIVKKVSAKYILDSRKEKTIAISIKTNVGAFSASSPNGKSKGKNEAKPYLKSLEEDIKTIKKFSDYFLGEKLEKFDDLRRIEDILDRHVGANTLFAFEAAVLKSIAKEKKKQIWQLINENQRKMPRIVGNIVGGGLHTNNGQNKKPDFQEFVIIPKEKTIKENFEISKKIKERIRQELKQKDEKFQEKRNDEDAWVTSLNEKEIFDILKQFKIDFGTDVASSSFFKRKKYLYNNPMLQRTEEEQLFYLSNLIKNYSLFYVEDPFSEEDFENFSKLLKKFPNSLIVGDDLTTTNSKRVEKAIKEQSINSMIIKPNQCGKLTEVKRVCELCKKNNIKMIFSHRSGETKEDILADLAFGFGADFLKCGVTGKERETKIKRLIQIEKGLK